MWDKKVAEDKDRYQKEMAVYSAGGPPPEEQATAVVSSALPTNTPKTHETNSTTLKKKRKKLDVSAASANLFASFLKKKPKSA
mmetsp:Transcript_5358/g.10382  ORF Transcript_5358/g.10382 Transcript_5358/m.10382 type:complete len:83 (+) Transcript_5358:1036-1284(+)